MAQLSVLKALDKQKVSKYHFTAIVIAGMGFFTDAYDLFSIGILTKLLGRLYYPEYATPTKPGVLPINVNAAISGVALCGTLGGQLFFGFLGDKFGRKKVYGLTLIMMIFSAIASGMSFGFEVNSVITTLCVFRFFLGFGIGGDYPLSATIMSEYANSSTRGGFIAAVFAMQGVGILTAAIVAIIVSVSFKESFHSPPYKKHPIPAKGWPCFNGTISYNGTLIKSHPGPACFPDPSAPYQADYIWRIILAFGAIPAALTYYWRMKMPETARYTALVEGNVNKAAADMSTVMNETIETAEAEQAVVQKATQSYSIFSRAFRKRYGWQLVGTSLSWFFLDIAFYSQNLFQKDVYSSIGWIPKAGTMNATEEVYRIARAQAILALCGTIPGYWFTVFLVDKIGRRKIQIFGFAMMTLFMAIIAGTYNSLRGHKCDPKKGESAVKDWCGGNTPAFVVLYGLTFFFANFGPNSTTFITPAELFPARYRSTCHGISAAAGKAGAIIGAFGFVYASQSSHIAEVDGYKTKVQYPKGIGIKYSLAILAITNGLGLLTSFLVPETMGKSLEELSEHYEEEEVKEINGTATMLTEKSGTADTTALPVSAV